MAIMASMFMPGMYCWRLLDNKWIVIMMMIGCIFDIISISGDLSKGCASAGAHFNPFNRTHGAPSDSERHVQYYRTLLTIQDMNLNALCMYVCMTDNR
jgi:hypothetical protein